jgi:hypothetical protein
MVVVSATTAAGAVAVLPGTTITYASGTANTSTGVYTLGTAAVSGFAGSPATVTYYGVYDPNNNASTDQFINPAVSGINTGYQTSNPDAIPLTGLSTAYTQSVNPINVYSFALAPEEHQPSGSCNFSRIDTTTLVFDSIVGMDGKALVAGSYPSKNYPYLFRMYAVNYNIFRVMSGMGGLAYSN